MIPRAFFKSLSRLERLCEMELMTALDWTADLHVLAMYRTILALVMVLCECS